MMRTRKARGHVRDKNPSRSRTQVQGVVPCTQIHPCLSVFARHSSVYYLASCRTVLSSVRTTILVEASVSCHHLFPPCAAQSCHAHDRSDKTSGPAALH